MIGQALIDGVRETVGIAGDPSGIRVVCAMSGGVDSTVTAALLKHAGFDVVGITLQLYDHGEAVRRKGACCAGQDIHDARRAAAALDIPHYVLDFESRFKEAVIDEFVTSYLAGETPIPCVTCNRTVKFADLLQRSRDLDAAVLATGHYVESRARPDGSGRRDMFTPADLSRDQSYFLFATTQPQLDYLRFPLGTLSKPETRAIAQGLGLGVADKPDSQDICFVPEGDYAQLIRKLRPEGAAPGDIVDMEGLGVAGGEPLYVVRIEASARRVVVGPREALKQTDIRVSGLNWLGEGPLGTEAQPVHAKIRSARPPVPADIRLDRDLPVVTIRGGEYGVSPGQACVLYEGEGAGMRVLGGGFIARP
jgi:tRNA-specific 2-thiouridylase